MCCGLTTVLQHHHVCWLSCMFSSWHPPQLSPRCSCVEMVRGLMVTSPLLDSSSTLRGGYKLVGRFGAADCGRSVFKKTQSDRDCTLFFSAQGAAAMHVVPDVPPQSWVLMDTKPRIAEAWARCEECGVDKACRRHGLSLPPARGLEHRQAQCGVRVLVVGASHAGGGG